MDPKVSQKWNATGQGLGATAEENVPTPVMVTMATIILIIRNTVEWCKYEVDLPVKCNQPNSCKNSGCHGNSFVKSA